MGRKVLPAGNLTYAQKKALYRAASYNGADKTEKLHNCLIKYRGDKAFIVPLETAAPVGVRMPNPFPFRGVVNGITDRGAPSIEVTDVTTGTDYEGTLTRSYVVKNSAGQVVATGSGTHYWLVERVGPGNGNRSTLSNYLESRLNFVDRSGIYDDRSGGALWVLLNGDAGNVTMTPLSPSYESILAADIAASNGGYFVRAVASNGEVLASAPVFVGSSQTTIGWNVSGAMPWSGAGKLTHVVSEQGIPGSIAYYSDDFVVPDDCIYPITEAPPEFPMGTAQIQPVSGVLERYTGGVMKASIVDPNIDDWGLTRGMFTADGIYTGGEAALVHAFASSLGRWLSGLNGGDVITYSIRGTWQDPLNTLVFTRTVRSDDNLWDLILDLADNCRAANAQVRAINDDKKIAADAAVGPFIERWYADWRAGVQLVKTRRKAWFKKNSDSVVAQLKEGRLPRFWDYAIKANAPLSTGTYREQPLGVMYSDSGGPLLRPSPTAKSWTVTRTVKMQYTRRVVQPDGTVQDELRSIEIVGTAEVTSTEHLIRENVDAPYFRQFYITYTNFYLPSTVQAESDAESHDGSPPWPEEGLLAHQLLEDMQTESATSPKGLGLLWNGSRTWFYYFKNGSFELTGFVGYPDSTWGLPQTLAFSAAYSPNNFTPPLPFTTNNLLGTVPQFVLEYRKDVPIKYSKGNGSTAWNDSAMMDSMEVVLTPVAAVGESGALGMFEDFKYEKPVNRVEIYGSAVFKYDYATGSFSFNKWVPLPGDAESMQLSVKSRPPYNCLVTYNNLHWPDVIEAENKAAAGRAAGQGDQTMKAIIDALKGAK